MKNLTKITTCFLMMVAAISGQAQEKASPAAVAQGKVNGAAVTINYSSPAVKGRVIWGGLVPFGKIWRAGANEATTIETDKDLEIEGQKLPAGKYSIFIIPNQSEATVIFNKVWKQSGTREYKESEDAIRVNIKPVVATTPSERLTYSVGQNKINLTWDNWILPISVQ